MIPKDSVAGLPDLYMTYDDLPAPPLTVPLPCSVHVAANEYWKRLTSGWNLWFDGPALLGLREQEELLGRAYDPSAPTGHIVEVGTGLGMSTVLLSIGNERRDRPGEWLVSVDLMPLPHDILRMAMTAVIAKNSKRTAFTVTDSGYAAFVGRGQALWRLAFIDGDHCEEAVRKDIAMIAPSMVDGGIILMHDVWNQHDKGPVSIWREAARDGGLQYGAVIVKPEPPYLAKTTGILRCERG